MPGRERDPKTGQLMTALCELSPAKENRPRIQSIGRGFDVLFVIARSHEGLHAKEVVRESGIDRQTVYHILQSLTAVGVVTKTAASRYVLGLKIADLVECFPRHLAPAERLGPLVRKLSQETGETAYAVGWVSGEIVALSTARGTKPVSAGEIPQGYASHAHARASGKLLLALAEPWLSAAYLGSHELSRLTANTITNRTRLQKEFDRIRAERVSIEREEFALGLCCIAVPVGEHGSSYALAISVPAERFEPNLDRYLDVVRRVAEGTSEPQ